MIIADGPKPLSESVNHPSHYQGGMEVIEMMERIFGKEKLRAFCELNAFKYRMRAGKKTESYQQDIEKALWYEKYIKDLEDEPRKKRKSSRCIYEEFHYGIPIVLFDL